jgi:hypothetical protein
MSCTFWSLFIMVALPGLAACGGDTSSGPDSSVVAKDMGAASGDLVAWDDLAAGGDLTAKFVGAWTAQSGEITYTTPANATPMPAGPVAPGAIALTFSRTSDSSLSAVLAYADASCTALIATASSTTIATVASGACETRDSRLQFNMGTLVVQNADTMNFTLIVPTIDKMSGMLAVTYTVAGVLTRKN